MTDRRIPPSPLEPLTRLGARLGVDLRVKRDDLLPVPGGGSKLRAAVAVLDECAARGHDAVVTNGGSQSNHARVIALEAARYNMSCALVLHGDPAALGAPTGNLLLMRLGGADIYIVPSNQIDACIRSAVNRLRAAGRDPAVVPGGAHCLTGTLAYVDAGRELADQCRTSDWSPDIVVVASGTGATQAGILAGLQRAGLPCEVIGVSVARTNPRGTAAVAELYEEACRQLGLPVRPDSVHFLDGWIGAGYEKASAQDLGVIRCAAQTEGLVLDPTYSGKAFHALVDLVHDGAIAPASRVVFWHTGGLVNLLAAGHSDGLSGG